MAKIAFGDSQKNQLMHMVAPIRSGAVGTARAGDRTESHMPDGSQVVSSHTRNLPANMADRLIVALDVADPKAAAELHRKLDGIVSFYKIGLWLLFAEGTDRLIDTLLKEKKDIFLDYKMFDIGQTVKQGVARAVSRGIRFVTVHGDPEIMKAAVEGRGDSDFTKIFSITVLTSLDDAALQAMGYALSVKDLIALRVRTSIECGCDGVIASADDNPDEIRRLFDHQRLLIATPGIRLPGNSVDDHKRHATPRQAIAMGADYLVVGRPITDAADPAKAALDIIADMEAGQRERAAQPA